MGSFVQERCVCKNLSVSTYMCDRTDHAYRICACFADWCLMCSEECTICETGKCKCSALAKCSYPLSNVICTAFDIWSSQKTLETCWTKGILQFLKCQLCDTTTCTIFKGSEEDVYFCKNCSKRVPFKTKQQLLLENIVTRIFDDDNYDIASLSIPILHMSNRPQKRKKRIGPKTKRRFHRKSRILNTTGALGCTKFQQLITWQFLRRGKSELPSRENIR